VTSGNNVVRRKSRLRRPPADNLLSEGGLRRSDDRPRSDHPPNADSLQIVDALLIVDVLLTMADRLRVGHPRNADGLSIVDDRLRVDHQPNRESNEPIVVVRSDRNARNLRLKPNA
jgi:hypothetical protein